MAKKIRLQTHDGSRNYLEEIEGRPNQYKLVCAVNSIGGGSLPNGEKYIDPSGGPMIAVGYPLAYYGKKELIVKSLTFEKGIGQIVTLE